MDHLILPTYVKSACQDLINEQNRSDLLRSYGIEPRNKLLLIGPPGNGKTSLAEAIAEALMVPLLTVRYESIIGSYLGETASRLSKLFEYAKTRQCVLFFDEFETLGKERGDIHETGEIKRVVSSLLMQIDALPSYVVAIAATNHDPEIIKFVDKSFDELKALDHTNRNSIWGKAIKENQRNLKVLAPAESLNGLTIGALYDDFSTIAENDRSILAVEKGLPSPISAIGKGYRSIITPDLFYYGGIKYLRKQLDGNSAWAISTRMPGCLSAAPHGAGDIDGYAFSFGTSDAAAQITHEAAKCHDVLNQVFISETGEKLPIDSTAILIKAMLTHGASWNSIANKLSQYMETSIKKLGRWLGNGIPNIDRVIECTKERITLIGLGALKKDEGNIFKLPIPVDFSSRLMKRKLTVTLAYLSPTAPNKQAYRCAQLWFNIDDGDKNLVPDRQNTEWQAVRKGTLQHEIFVGENPIVWNDDNLIIKVNCKEDADKIRTAIPYCIFVSFEVAEGYDVDLYTAVSTKIHQQIQITNN